MILMDIGPIVKVILTKIDKMDSWEKIDNAEQSAYRMGVLAGMHQVMGVIYTAINNELTPDELKSKNSGVE